MDTPEELTLDQRLSVRFRLNCFAALLPRELRPAALDAWAASIRRCSSSASTTRRPG